MSLLGVKRTTEPLHFNTGIGEAKFAEIIDSPVSGQPQKPLLPGSTTVSQALDALFPTNRSVSDQIMRSLVANNSMELRTATGFGMLARDTLESLRNSGKPAADMAAREIELLLADTDLFDHYRLALLES